MSDETLEYAQKHLWITSFLYGLLRPMVNQMETHVFNQQHETRKFMDEFGTKLMAWAPLAEGQNGLFTNPHSPRLARNTARLPHK